MKRQQGGKREVGLFVCLFFFHSGKGGGRRFRAGFLRQAEHTEVVLEDETGKQHSGSELLLKCACSLHSWVPGEILMTWEETVFCVLHGTCFQLYP